MPSSRNQNGHRSRPKSGSGVHPDKAHAVLGGDHKGFREGSRNDAEGCFFLGGARQESAASEGCKEVTPGDESSLAGKEPTRIELECHCQLAHAQSFDGLFRLQCGR